MTYSQHVAEEARPLLCPPRHLPNTRVMKKSLDRPDDVPRELSGTIMKNIPAYASP